MDRREYLKLQSVMIAGLAMPRNALSMTKARNLKLGFDNFSIRQMGWKAPAVLAHAAKLGVDVLMFSDLDVYEDLGDDYLDGIKAKAKEYGIELHAGTGSICDSSGTFKDTHGTGIEHLQLAIRVAARLGSPVVRCFLGNSGDRKSDGGIERHQEIVIKNCQAVRSQAMDAGIKIAIENHAGDQQGWELAQLIEAAGPEFVGATIDSGNATWSLEDPTATLEALGPYAVSSGMRDSHVVSTDHGLNVRWTAMGEGLTDWDPFIDRWMELCPDTPFILEIISGLPRDFDYKTEEFWSGYETLPAKSLSGLIRMGQKGDAKAMTWPEELDPMEELSKSVTYCRDVLGIRPT